MAVGQKHTVPPKSGIASPLKFVIPSLRQYLGFSAFALIIGLDSICFAIALASLMFAGELSSGIGMAVTAVLGCSILMSVIVGWKSHLKINIAGAQDIGVAVLAVSLTAAVSNVATESKVATAFAIIAAATLSTGLILFATGYFRAGRMVRFFPLEVLAGFMAATGCLLLLGGIAMVCRVDATLAGMLTINSSQQFWHLVPALVLATIIALAMQHFRKPMVLLAILISAAAAFHLWLRFSMLSASAAIGLGLLPDVPATQNVTFAFPTLLPFIEWSAVIAAAPMIGTVALLSLFAAMMNISAIELSTGKELDVDHEVKLVGSANLMAAGVGGPPGFSDLTSTQLLHKSGVANRGVGLAVAVVELLGLFYAAYVASLVPVLVSAALVIYYGFDLVRDWLLATRKSYNAREWGVVLLIVLISVFYSILLAIVAGFLIATMLFAYSYSNAPVIRNVTTLAKLPSTTDRAPHEAFKLSEQGKGVQVIQLQGFLFFGTSEQVVQRVRQAAAVDGIAALKTVIIDFSRVTDLDSASANAFKRIDNLAVANDFSVAFCGLNDNVAKALRRSAISVGVGAGISFYDDLDIALAAIESKLLKAAVTEPNERSLASQFASAITPERELEELFALMTVRLFAPGDIIIKAGTEAKHIYFIKSGRAVVYRSAADTSRKRLRTMAAGAILGEVAYSLGSSRTADVVAEIETKILCLSLAQAKKMERDNPPLAILLNQLISRALAEKVLAANRMTEHMG